MSENGSNTETENNDSDPESTTALEEAVPEANTLPNYLLRRDHSKNPIRLEDVVEENKELGTGGDSDDECIDAIDFGDIFAEVESSRIRTAIDDNTEINACDSIQNCVDLIDDEILKYHVPPDDWVHPEPNLEKEEPFFNNVDNPGHWSSFWFQSVFKKKRPKIQVSLSSN